MECRKCGHDLLVRIEPKGLGNLLRLVPLAPYVCVKCGARHWRASDDWGRTGTRAALMGAVLAAMVWAIWYAGRPAGPAKPPAPSNVVREEVTAQAAPHLPTEVPLDEAGNEPAREPVMVAQAEPAQPVTTESLRQSAGESETGLDEVDVEPAPADKPEAAPEAAPNAATDAEPDKGWLNPAPDRLVGESAPATKGPGTVTAIDFLAETDRLLITVAAGGPVENAVVHVWPPKFVVDLPGRWNWSGPKEIPVGTRGVVRIRTGADKEHFRIVLDMKPMPKTPPEIQTSPGGLLILVK